MSNTQPLFPIYVVSHNRAENCRTPRYLRDIGVSFSIVIEKDDYDSYRDYFDADRLLTVPQRYHDDYETYDDLGDKKPNGPGPARNFAWDHAEDAGHDFHWVMDDNISYFLYYVDNHEVKAGDGTVLRAMEDFVRQYKNISMAGPRYEMFNIKREKRPPITANTRIYSCNLIRNDTGYEWKGRYNEDTDLSLRMLKDGWCTVLFGLLLQKKRTTQTYSGGNTENFYSSEGTYNKSKMLKEQHPDVTTLTKKWGRWHHRVNYRPFKGNELRKKDGPPESGNYNLSVVPRDNHD